MELKAIGFTTDENGTWPDRITVEMTQAEAAAVAALFGLLNGHAYDRLGGYEKVGGIYSCLVGDVFNRYYENGVDEVRPQPMKLDLATLNEPLP